MTDQEETIEAVEEERIIGKYICRVCGDFIEVNQKEYERYSRRPPKHCDQPMFFYINKNMSRQHLLAMFVILREDVLQTQRIGINNRIAAIERGADETSPAALEMLKRWYNRFKELEDQATEDIAEISGGIAIIDHMVRVKGVGRTLASKVISKVDISKARTVSALWRYAGYGVIDGERERLRRGERSHYNSRLKTYCHQVATSMMRTGSPYRQVYEDARARYELVHPEWTKAHSHNASLRKMIKIWLAHLYLEWRELEGLPVRPPYVVEHMPGHSDTYKPADFGWHDED